MNTVENVVRLPSDQDYPLAFTAYADIDVHPRKEWLVRGFFGATEMSCKFGEPGSAKSALAGDLAAHVAAGKPWFGRQVSHGSVIYVACERPALVKRRFAAWRAHHGIDDLPLAVISTTVDLCSGTKDAEQIITCADKWSRETGLDPRLIILDTVSRALSGGDENSPRDMGRLVSNLQLIQDKTGAHVQAVHHVPIGGANRMRGHGCLLGACDTTVSLEKLDGSIRTATTAKNNDGPTGERLAFFLTTVELGRDRESGEVTTAPVVIPAKGNIPEKKRRDGDKWSKSLTVFRDALTCATKAYGRDHQSGDCPVVKAVTRDQVRAEHKRLYVHTGEGDRQAAERQAWGRALKNARERNFIAAETVGGSELIWQTVNLTLP